MLFPNDAHQADLLYLPHDKYKRKTYKYALCIVDVASRYKVAIPIVNKTSGVVADAFQVAYKTTKLKYPKLLMVDQGSEFKGETIKLMKQHDVNIQRGDPSQHRSQGIVERFNRTLAERLFSYQYQKELEDTSKRNNEWSCEVT